MKDKVLWIVIGGVLAYAGTQLSSIAPTKATHETEIKNLQQKTDENRESIQALIDLHLNK
jgi:hypothetical protein